MLKNIYHLYLLIFLVFVYLIQFPVNAQEQNKNPKPENYVVLISIDGMKPEYYTKADQYKLKIPNLRAFCREGSFAEGSETVYPSLTYPSHTTLVTGNRPATHGIISNQTWRGLETNKTEEWYWYANAIKSPTLWTEARKAGLKTGAVAWPATAGAEIDYLIPEIWEGSFNTSFKTSIAKSTAGLSELILKSLPDPPPTLLNDLVRVQAAKTIISKYKPNLLLVHFVEVDYQQHRKGIFSSEAKAKLEETDEFIGQIINATKEAGIFEKTSFFVVSDHGFAPVEKQFRPAVLLAKEGFITIAKDGQVIEWQALPFGQGGSTAIMMKNPNDKISEFKIIEMLEKFANKPNSPINRVVKRAELDKLGSSTEASCFLEAAPGYEINSELTGSLTENSKDYLATHGGLPTRSEMYASFIASGHGIKKGVHEPFTKNIHVAPTIATILGFSLPQAEGRPIRQILTVEVPKIKAVAK